MTDPTPDEAFDRYLQVSAGIEATGNALTLIVQGVLIGLRQMALIMINPFREAYRLAGAPYGDTDEGLDRWIDELREGVRQDLEAWRDQPLS